MEKVPLLYNAFVPTRFPFFDAYTIARDLCERIAEDGRLKIALAVGVPELLDMSADTSSANESINFPVYRFFGKDKSAKVPLCQ